MSANPRLQYAIETYQQGSERLEIISNHNWEFLENWCQTWTCGVDEHVSKDESWV